MFELVFNSLLAQYQSVVQSAFHHSDVSVGFVDNRQHLLVLTEKKSQVWFQSKLYIFNAAPICCFRIYFTWSQSFSAFQKLLKRNFVYKYFSIASKKKLYRNYLVCLHVTDKTRQDFKVLLIIRTKILHLTAFCDVVGSLYS